METTTASPAVEDGTNHLHEDDPTERSLGICEYLSPLSTEKGGMSGFYAVSKARFSDFVVHEVGVDGRVARLDCMEPHIREENELETTRTTSTSSTPQKAENNGETKEETEGSVATDGGDSANDNRKRKRQELEGQHKQSTTPKPAPAPQRAARAAVPIAVPSSLDWEQVERELVELTAGDAADEANIAKAVVAFLQNKPSKTTTTVAASASTSTTTTTTATMEEGRCFVSLVPCPDKARRRALHQWIRERLHSVARADTDPATKAVRLWRLEYEHQMPNYQKFDNRNNNNRNQQQQPRSDCNKNGSKYIRFVLYKENMDTGTAIRQLQRIFSNNNNFNRGGGRNNNNNNRGGRHQFQQPVRLGYAGMKDKRGVTAQFVTVPAHKHQELQRYCQGQRRITADTTNKNGSSGGGGGHTQSAGVGLLRIGNLEYASSEVSLGRLQGNRFDICLRNVVVSQEADDESTTTDTISSIRQRLQDAAGALRQHGFINYFGVQRFGKFHDTHTTGIAVLKGDYAAAVDIVMRPKLQGEGERQQHVQKARAEWQARFENNNKNCPKTMSTDETETATGTTGEDVKDEEKERSSTTTNTSRAEIERECAKRILPQFGKFMGSEVAILQSLVRYPLDYKRAFSSIDKTMRMMFLHAVQSHMWNHVASFRITMMTTSSSGQRGAMAGDLVYEQDDDTENKNNNKRAVRVVTPEDVAASRYSIEDVVLPLIGTQTRDPDNASGKLFNKLLEKEGLTRDAFFQVGKQDRQLDVTGDYRKLICHPTDVDYEIIEYDDALEPLLQTDLMKLQGIEIKAKPKQDDTKMGDTDKNKDTKRLVAMNVGFTLPSSSYATIALRELMKRPTSGDYQRFLSVGGDVGAAAEKKESTDGGGKSDDAVKDNTNGNEAVPDPMQD